MPRLSWPWRVVIILLLAFAIGFALFAFGGGGYSNLPVEEIRKM